MYHGTCTYKVCCIQWYISNRYTQLNNCTQYNITIQDQHLFNDWFIEYQTHIL